ncbi:MAG: VWA domain-containing protein [Chloroflexi bacterium]|nr:VWA domain-containing protein [Chloroflexota bacterium]
MRNTRTAAHKLGQLGWYGQRYHMHWAIMAIISLGMALLGLLPVGVVAAPGLTVRIQGVDASEFPWVTSRLTVLNGDGYPVQGLHPANFALTEDGVPVEAMELLPGAESKEPLAVVVVVDVSGSVQAQAMQDAKTAAATFIKGLDEQDQVSLMAFSTGVRPLTGFTSDKQALLQAVNALRVGGSTALYDALAAAVEAAGRSRAARRVVVLETDGYDTSSKAKLEDGIALARQLGVRVYTIGLGTDLDKNILNQMAVATGGTALFAPTSGDLAQAYQEISGQLRSQYVVRYRSPAPKGAKGYRLAVTVSHLQDQASAETTFTANPAPPRITGFSLADGAVLSAPATVAVDVAAVHPVTAVWLEVGGRRIAQTSAPPFSFTLDPHQLPGGQQDVTVGVTDRAGSTASTRVFVTIPAGTGAGAAPGLGFLALVGIDQRLLLVVLSLVILAAVLAYEAWKLAHTARQRLQHVTCPTCKAQYPAYEGTCPDCWVEQRLEQEAHRTLADVLVENKLLGREDLEAALAQSAAQRKPLEALLLESGKVRAEQLHQARFYLSRSAAMVDRRRELLASRTKKHVWDAKVFAPGLVVLAAALAVLLLAAALWGVGLTRL